MKQETIDRIHRFTADRNWDQFHTPANLAKSISIEANELLECFQWSGSDTSAEGRLDGIREELADVVNYCILMADVCGINLDEAVREKVRRNEEKYPVEKAYGRSDKYTEYED